MAKTKSQRMKEYRKKSSIRRRMAEKEHARVKNYYIHVAQLSKEKQQQRRMRNRVDCTKYRRKMKLRDAGNDNAIKNQHSQ
jgi:hypothetical protein